jgi:hypothetical protein
MPLFKNWSAKLFKQKKGNTGEISLGLGVFIFPVSYENLWLHSRQWYR